MSLLNKNTDYAVRALLQCALTGGEAYLSSSEISRAQGIPLRFLRVLLQKLIKGGLLESREGKGGGVRLAVPPAKISVLSVLRLMQEGGCVSQCLFRKRQCPMRSSCVLRPRLLAIEKKLELEFSLLTIGGMAAELSKSARKLKPARA